MRFLRLLGLWVSLSPAPSKSNPWALKPISPEALGSVYMLNTEVILLLVATISMSQFCLRSPKSEASAFIGWCFKGLGLQLDEDQGVGGSKT